MFWRGDNLLPSILFLVFMYLSEWLIVYSYAKSIFKKRNRFSMMITIVLYAVLMLLYKFITNIEAFNLIFTLICNILCVYIGFKSNFKSAFFHGTTLVITQFVSEVVAIYIISLISSSPNDSYTENSVIYMTDVIISKMLYFAVSRFLLKFSNKENSTKSWGRWVALSILPLSSLFIILASRLLTNGLTFSFSNSIIFISSLVFLLIANVIVYLIYEQAEKSNQKLIELELVNQKNDIDMQYLELLEKKNETMNIMAHDYKNNLLTIAGMTDSSEVKDYIDNMMGEITKYNQIAKTKNRLLDVILSKYTDICNNKGITFETDIMTDNLGFINSYDISTLFNNILDNAVEAASISSKKNIRLEITNSLNSYHKIIAINSCDVEPHAEHGKLLTSKKNKDTHGFGTKSIKRIVQKYNGEMQWEYDNDQKQFKLVILFPKN